MPPSLGLRYREAFKRSVGYYEAEAWNALDADTQNTGSYMGFKKDQKRLLLLLLELVP